MYVSVSHSTYNIYVLLMVMYIIIQYILLYVIYYIIKCYIITYYMLYNCILYSAYDYIYIINNTLKAIVCIIPLSRNNFPA